MSNVIFSYGVKSQYTSLVTKDVDTLYFITDTGEIYKGDILISDKTNLNVEFTSVIPEASTSQENILYVATVDGKTTLWVKSGEVMAQAKATGSVYISDSTVISEAKTNLDGTYGRNPLYIDTDQGHDRLIIGGGKIGGLTGTPSNSHDAATKKYVDYMISALDLFVNPDDGLLCLTHNGDPIGDGTALPETGTGFDAVSIDESGFLHITKDGEDVVDPVYIGKDGASGSGSSAVTSVNGKTGDVKLPVSGFGTCATAAATAIKVVDGLPEDFLVEDGVQLCVKFSNANTAAAPQLSVAGASAPIFDARTSNNVDAAGIGARTHHFVYFSGIWVLLDAIQIPVPTSDDNGKFLRVSGHAYVLEALTDVSEVGA